MSTNAVEKIREAEQMAEKTEREAIERAQSIIEKAKVECEECLRAAKTDGEDSFIKSVDACQKAADDESKKAKLGFENELEALKALAESKFEKAVGLVKEKLIS
ncbi:MAG: hypothetical protein IJW15_02980 [Clostridia bacterium]|nr:hypothetical protein [Clostridia bacterium]